MSIDAGVQNNGGVLGWFSSFVFSDKAQNYADLRTKEFVLKSAFQTVGNLVQLDKSSCGNFCVKAPRLTHCKGRCID